jgi:hypothetical protein
MFSGNLLFLNNFLSLRYLLIMRVGHMMESGLNNAVTWVIGEKDGLEKVDSFSRSRFVASNKD